MGLMIGGIPVAGNDEVSSWKAYIEKVKPITDLLTSKGFSLGEAMVCLELNYIAGQLNYVIEACNRISSDDEQKPWEG